MKKLFIAAALVGATSIIIVSCKKDKGSSGTPKTKTELLTGPYWIGTDAKLSGSSVWGTVDACSKDDFNKFNTDFTGVTDEGATKCNASDPQTTNFNWKFLNNETQLVYDGDTATIVELSETAMRLSIPSDLGTIELDFGKK